MVSLGFDSKSYLEAKTLVENNYEAKLIFPSSEKESSKKQRIEGINVEKVYLPSFNIPLLHWFLLFVFWLKISFKLLLESNFDVIHCHDFHTLPIGVIIKKIKNTKLVYDAHEFYPASVRNDVPLILYKLVSLMDRFFIAAADCLIIPNNERKIFYQRARKIIVVLNTVEYIEIPKKKRSDVFTLFYAGGLGEKRGLRFVVKAVKRINGIKFVLAGWGPKLKWLEKLSEENDKITILARLATKELLGDYLRLMLPLPFMNPQTKTKYMQLPVRSSKR